MSKSIKLDNDNYIEASSISYKKTKLYNILDNYLIGRCRQDTVIGSYVKLFTLTLSNVWKTYNILFYLTDTQNRWINSLVSLNAQRTPTQLELNVFKSLNFGADISTNLYTVVIRY